MKLNEGSLLRALTDTFPRNGRLEWIGVRPERRAPIVELAEAEARVERGLTGDYRARSPGSRRQVTLIQHEHLAVVAKLLGHATADPALARRNLAVSGINVLALKDEVFAIGDVVFQGTGVCAPCSKMEKYYGEGGYNALRGHGGITALVVVGGVIRRGDDVRRVAPDELAPPPAPPQRRGGE
jgi:MOSC domain-containing protein YiiM